MVTLASIQPALARDTVRVTFADGSILEGALNTPLSAFLSLYAAEQTPPLQDLMGGIVDGRLRELAYPLTRDASVAPICLSDSDGGRIYRRTLVLLMSVALDELSPDAKVTVRYAIPEGGYYCTLSNRPPLTDAELTALDDKMHQMVAADHIITKRSATLEDAIKQFKAHGDDDKVRLLEQRTRNGLTLYGLLGREDYFFGYMLPSTGSLKYFKLVNANDGGFVLQYPRKENPTELEPITLLSKISTVFYQSDQWLDRLNVADIGHLNRIVRDNRVHELILVAEALHEQQVASLAGQIQSQADQRGARIVLIAGPSSSGKTTFSKRLAIQLLANGLRPVTIELDNYFVDRHLTPRDAKGDYDFESIGAINRDLFNDNLLALLAGEEVQLPSFDFKLGKSSPGRILQLQPNQILVIEGIHGLNPQLVPNIPPEKLFRIYVSALTQLNTDAHNRISTTDVRMLRRIVRDAQHRGYSATDTIARWPSVRNGEKFNIFPYQENADALFNSALPYELAALRPLAEPLLLQVEPATPPHIEANRLLSFLKWVYPFTPEQAAMIPDTSLLREFIGGSSLQDYHPGEMHGD